MRIALLQMTGSIDPAHNADMLVEGIAEAKAGGARMLFTPEMSGLLDRDRKRAAAHLAVEGEDPVLAAVRKAAAEQAIWLHLGSLALRADAGPSEDSGRLVNRGFVIDDSGDIRARYDKIHLFDVDLDTGESWRESSTYDAGEQAVIADTPLGPLGLSVCYDLRFADLYRTLSDAGATLLGIPAAFTVPTGKAHWHVLMRARAIESAAFVIAAAQVGRHEDGRETYGHSLVVDPWGEILLDMEETSGVGFADIDTTRIDEVRRRIPVLDHRRAFAAPEPSA
ncbi:carbon-nitrogen hydrolase family protein [Parasphingopyxis algicola]|uniref:carbon-nitrogen hydrolase family protein n=1 Tax=Parasphingopyxis algicola TaxID=2026624 RepID=UPI0015A2F90B|nr:carbon-nitrogen hydrolase family protein [Parasphingopyxis algicola]QLC23784.1 carbon-nitrogen hydrolase family protein [Parasphingopyxis algicola]